MLSVAVPTTPNGRALRILQLGKYYPPTPGGIESVTADLSVALLELGHQVRVLAHQGKDEAKGPAVLHGVDLERVRTYGQLLFAPLSPGFGRALRRVIKSFSPDVVHAHVPNLSAFWALRYLPADVPLVLHWHSDITGGRFSPLRLAYATVYGPLERALLARAAAVIVTSPPYLASSQPLAPFRHKCEVVPLGLDLARATAETATEDRTWARAQWAQTSALKVVFAGRLSHYKGLDTLLTALTEVPSADALLIGEGEMRHRVRRAITRQHLRERVTLVGHQTTDRLRAALEHADVLVLPSRWRTEAFGVVLLEALALGTPVIAADIPGSGAPWVVDQSGGGATFATADPSALAQVLATVASQPARWQAYATTGQHQVTTVFTAAQMAAKVAAVFARVACRR